MTEQKKDLNQYMDGHLYRFWHNPAASMRIWNETKGGNILFPYDPMTEKVRNIRKYRIYSEEGVKLAFEKCGDIKLSFEEARKALAESGSTVVDNLPFAYTEKEIMYINNLFRKMYPGNFS